MTSIGKPAIGLGVLMSLAGAIIAFRGNVVLGGVFGFVGLSDVLIGAWLLKRENASSK